MTTQSQAKLTATRLRNTLSYSKSTGLFRWKTTLSNRAVAGNRAGTVKRNGHTQIQVEGQVFQGSHLAWIYVTGKPPPAGAVVVYKNKKPDDLRWRNIREAA